MSRAKLTVDLGALADNWRALDAMSACETAAVVKADGYGLRADRVGPALTEAGVKTFFVAQVEEGAVLREAVGPAPRIFVFAGLMPGDEELMRGFDLIPLLNSAGQLAAAKSLATRGDKPFTVGIQLDSGMNRLGFEETELNTALADDDALDGLDLALVMSHLACADEPTHEMNAIQSAAFRKLSAHPALASVPKSLAATGGVLLGPDFHHDMTRPGVGLYGGLPFEGGKPVVTLEAPIIQIRDVEAGEAVGYAATWRPERSCRIATLSIGYADGFIRHLSNGFTGYLNGKPVPSAGRVSMDLVTMDVTDHPEACEGAMITLLGAEQTVDQLAKNAGTIGYEILTSLGARFERRYITG